MTTSTTRGVFPYPISSDPDNVPSDLSALANRAATVGALFQSGTIAARTTTPTTAWTNSFYYATDVRKLSWWDGTQWTDYAQFPGFVSSKPTTPYSNQECYYIAESGSNTIWHLKYNGTLWLIVGGGPFIGVDNTSHTISTSNWFSSTSIAAPLAGVYRVSVSGYVYGATGAGSDFLYQFGLSTTNTVGGPSIGSQQICMPHVGISNQEAITFSLEAPSDITLTTGQVIYFMELNGNASHALTRTELVLKLTPRSIS